MDEPRLAERTRERDRGRARRALRDPDRDELFPHIDVATTTEVLFAALALVLAVAGAYVARGRRTAPAALDVPAGGRRPSDPDRMPAVRERWTMPRLELLERPVWSRTRRIGMFTLRGYLLVAVLMLVVKAVEIGLGH